MELDAAVVEINYGSRTRVEASWTSLQWRTAMAKRVANLDE